MLLATTILPITAMAGDENDPEITDNLNDQFGALAEHPNRIRTRIALVLLQLDSFDFMDINSAWFHEDEQEPDFLYATLKLKDLQLIPQDVIYTVRWTVNGEKYCVCSHIFNNGQNISCDVAFDRRRFTQPHEAEVTYNYDKDTVTFKINKKYFGDPQPGDLITKTWAWTALRFNFEPLCLVFSDGELIKDVAPFLENNNVYGRDYQIVY